MKLWQNIGFRQNSSQRLTKRLCMVSRYYKLIIFIWIYCCIFLLNGCCKSKYSFYLYHKKGEEALLSKNYKKAKNYYSIIYEKETKMKKIDKYKTNWAFYRLGVISELTGDLKRAKGYYWGDSIKDGFYSEQKLISWFAQAGWKQIDEKNKARTLDEILALEKTKPIEVSEDEIVENDIEKEVIVQKKSYSPSPRRNINSSTGVIKSYSDSRILPPDDAPEPFKFYY